jgi:hypothetical protein
MTRGRDGYELEVTLLPIGSLTRLSSRAKRGIWILLFTTASWLTSAQSTLPLGWRRPSPAEVSDAWRKRPEKFLMVKADFDGDGHADVAEISANDAEKRCALFVWLSSNNEWKLLWNGGTPLRNIGASLVCPGKYDTLCGDDPSVCNPETPKSVNLVHSVASLFFEGETSSFFY